MSTGRHDPTAEASATVIRMTETTAHCDYCGHAVTPANPRAEGHICRECALTKIQIADKDHDIGG